MLLLSKEVLQQRVLADKRLEIYECGRTDIATGQIDRRVLATLEYLAERGFDLTITSLKCGHGFLTTSGNVSNHSSGNAVDIAAVNGIPILGHQGPGSITDTVLREVLRLQGTMAPEELISLEELGGPSFALPDHNDHIHIGWQPMYCARAPGPVRRDAQAGAVEPPDRPPRRDRQPGSPHRALRGLGARQGQGRQGLGGAKVAKSGGTESGD